MPRTIGTTPYNFKKVPLGLSTEIFQSHGKSLDVDKDNNRTGYTWSCTDIFC